MDSAVTGQMHMMLAVSYRSWHSRTKSRSVRY